MDEGPILYCGDAERSDSSTQEFFILMMKVLCHTSCFHLDEGTSKGKTGCKPCLLVQCRNKPDTEPISCLTAKVVDIIFWKESMASSQADSGKRNSIDDIVLVRDDMKYIMTIDSEPVNV